MRLRTGIRWGGRIGGRVRRGKREWVRGGFRDGKRAHGCTDASTTSYGAWFDDWDAWHERVRWVVMESSMEQLRKAALRRVTMTASNEGVWRGHTH